ncbi:MAG: general secretion pathway protein GspK [Comamonadaceae bacterium]|nr:general secretion pathway protein GspK [Comamonadaceae bacterium]
MKHPLRRFASPPSRGAALAVRQSRPGGALGGARLCGAGGHHERGAALLLAMLTVTLVATLASAALWQQWRATEVETAERQRVQAAWILTGALDWARLILREDARSNQNSGNPDHLGEPWATPLEEARLSSFLAADKSNNTDDTLQAFLSGEVIDLQSRMNFLNLVKASGSGASASADISPPDLLAFTRLYRLLDLPQSELDAAVQALLVTTRLAANDPQPSHSALIPAKLAQLAWLGMGRASLAALEPHVTVLPERTPINLNTASAQVLSASVPDLSLAMAQKLVGERERNPFRHIADAARVVPTVASQLTDANHDVRSRYFEVRGRLRLDDTVIEERSQVVRNNLQVRVNWRERITSH